MLRPLMHLDLGGRRSRRVVDCLVYYPGVVGFSVFWSRFTAPDWIVLGPHGFSAFVRGSFAVALCAFALVLAPPR